MNNVHINLNPSDLAAGDELHSPGYPHMRYTVAAVDDLHVEIRDQFWVGVIYTHAEFRQHMGDARKVGKGEQRKSGWFE